MTKRQTLIYILTAFLTLPSMAFGVGIKDIISNHAYRIFSAATGVGSAFEGSTRMDDISIKKDGAGYYAFGKYVRGGNHWSRMNFWFPYKSYRHGMNTSLQEKHITPDQLIADLKKAGGKDGKIQFAFWLDHQGALLEECIKEFVNKVGTNNFAISLVYNTKTHGISFYVNVDSNASHNTIHNTKLIKIIKDNIRRRIAADPDAYPKYGKEIKDHFSVSFGKPLIVFYILGTGELYFH